MSSFTDLVQQGAGHAWLFFPSAIVLGALHGLEPGHSKTMMAAFIIAVRGTIAQAVLLGLAAAISHSALIWLIAGTGLYFRQQFDLEAAEPYFQLASAVIIAGMALWMLWRTHRDLKAAHDHAHGHAHPHDEHGHAEDHSHHDHPHAPHAGGDFQDAHERAHAEEIEQRFAGRQVGTGQIVLFGITGGLMPCPAAFTVLIVCLQLKQLVLGFALVLAFSLGLALTLVGTGVIAAWSLHHAQKRFSGFGEIMRKAPYISSAILLVVAGYIALQAWHALALRS